MMSDAILGVVIYIFGFCVGYWVSRGPSRWRSSSK
jgi:hypothetical protein